MQKKYLLYVSQNYAYSILRPIQEVIRARGDSVAWFMTGNMAENNYLDENETHLKTIKEVMAFNPCVVFASSNVLPYFFPGIKVELFHGFNTYKRGATAHFNIRGFFDLYCTQGPDTTAPFMQLEKKYGYFKVVETGWPKLDPMFSKTQNFKKNEKPIILYTSTFSKDLTSAPTLLNTIEELSKNNQYQWRVTFHPKMDKAIINSYKNIQNNNLIFIETDNVIPLLLEADMMICDTSSILQEFLLLNKPVVTFKNNNPIDCLINIKTVAELLPAIEKALTRPKELLNKIKRYAEQLHPYTDGQSSQRVLDAVDEFLKKDKNKLKRKPLNLIRKFKIRKKLGYFKF